MKLRSGERQKLREWLLGSYGDWAGVRSGLKAKNLVLSQSSLDRFFAGTHSDRTFRQIALLLGTNAEGLRSELAGWNAPQHSPSDRRRKIDILQDPDAFNVALRIYVEMRTRKVAIMFNPAHDLVKEIYSSWYAFFQVAREDIKSIPLYKDSDSVEMRRLFRVSQQILNDGLRPHLERWQGRFRRWMETGEKRAPHITPQEAQKEFPEWNLLRDDLIATNQRLINYATILAQMIGQPEARAVSANGEKRSKKGRWPVDHRHGAAENL